MEELTYHELIEISSLLRMDIVETKCFIETFGDNGYRAETLKRLESAYKKIEAMIARARCGKEGSDDGVHS